MLNIQFFAITCSIWERWSSSWINNSLGSGQKALKKIFTCNWCCSCWLHCWWWWCSTILISWKCWANRHRTASFFAIKELTLFVIDGVQEVLASWHKSASPLTVSCWWNIINETHSIRCNWACFIMKVLKLSNQSFYLSILFCELKFVINH